MIARSVLVFFVCVLATTAPAQLLDGFSATFDRCDTLRGSLRPERTCFDVTSYDLALDIEFADSSIAGTNAVHFTVVEPTDRIQLDLFENMVIDRVVDAGTGAELDVERECAAVFIDLGRTVPVGERMVLKVHYHGRPRVAVNAPWDGGFTWTTDGAGHPWLGVSCQGIGASLWWPNKDHLSDEPDSMRITATVPPALSLVANGELERGELGPEDSVYTWRVGYPINNYNVTLNVGDYTAFFDTYTSSDGRELALQYYVLPEHLDTARVHFQQVKPMLACYETYLGDYPFWEDGFALVETPYLGMEHQGAIAYGNGYQPGYAGWDYSRIGLDFDYIIIHEAGHEWWGNSVSVADIADLWIHEGFCTYSEAIYVECLHGYDTAMAYINAKKPFIGNEHPVLGIHGVNHEGDGDMYSKGMLFLNTLRHLVDDDEAWWAGIKTLVDERFAQSIVSTDDILGFFNETFDKDFTATFEQYLAHPHIPVLLYRLEDRGDGRHRMTYRWLADADGFDMPVRIHTPDGGWRWIRPSATLQRLTLEMDDAEDLRFDTDRFYFDTKRYDL